MQHFVAYPMFDCYIPSTKKKQFNETELEGRRLTVKLDQYA